MMHFPDLISAAARHVTEWFAQHPAPSLYYHKLAHTQGVVNAAEEIMRAQSLPEAARAAVLVAAWFHDVGHLKQRAQHEIEGARQAQSFLAQQSVSEEFVAQVKELICATVCPQKPEGKLQEIICDADMAHLAQDDYLAQAEALRLEVSAQMGKKIKKQQWSKDNQRFFEQHTYFTEYARQHWAPRKQKNYEGLAEQQKGKAKKSKKAKKKKGISSREAGVLFRIIFRNHMDLSAIADTKANIMISVNSILLSVLVTVLFRNLDDYPDLWLPSAILATVCLLAIVFAVLATLPRVTHGSFRQGDEAQRRAKLLFFGNFHDMPLPDFLMGMKQVINDDGLVYDSLSRDLHFLGKVLHRKYMMLRKSYLIFVIGWVVSIVAFVIVSFYRAELF